MPLDGFLRLSATLEPSAAVLAAVTARLPGVYGRMTVDGSLTKCATNPFAPSRSLPSLAVRQWAHERVTDYSLDERHADRRVKLAAVRNRQPVDNSRGVMPQLGEVKAASDAEVLARAYAMYKLGLLQSLEDDPAFPLTARLVVHQNYA
jgi:hypothetical protein